MSANYLHLSSLHVNNQNIEFVHIWKHFLLIYKFKYLGCLFKSKQPKKATAPRMPHLVVTVPPLKSPATGSSFLGRANFWSVLRIRVVNPYQECRDKPPFPAIVGKANFITFRSTLISQGSWYNIKVCFNFAPESEKGRKCLRLDHVDLRLSWCEVWALSTRRSGFLSFLIANPTHTQHLYVCFCTR